MKEENIVSKELDEAVELDGYKVKAIKFDLEHINRGWDIDNHDYKLGRRSNYNAEDIVEFFEQLGYYAIEWSEGENKHKVEVRGRRRMRYYAFVYDHDAQEQKKMVIDIPDYFESEGIIVTLY